MASKNLNNDESLSLDIEADYQFLDGDIVYSEGNVILYLDNAKLNADKVSFDKEKKILIVSGNISFFKGSQYIQADKLFYDLTIDEGYLNNAYGVLDISKVGEDFNLQIDNLDSANVDYKKKEISDFEYLNTTNIGLVNDFEKDKRFNITDLNFDVPKITKWRFKAEKIKIKSNTLTSDKIIFTNDAYNKPQFLFISKKFSGFIENDKLKLISRNSWINLDNKIKFPIGRRSIVDREPISRWGFGSDQDLSLIHI